MLAGVPYRLAAATISTALIALVAWPGARRDLHRADSFPLSTYPMFASPRSTTVALDYAIGLRRDGISVPIPPRLVGSTEVLQARAIIARAVAGGERERSDLCRRIALRLAAAEAGRGVDFVALVSGRHDAVSLLEAGRRGTELERVRCPVAGTAQP